MAILVERKSSPNWSSRSRTRRWRPSPAHERMRDRTRHGRRVVLSGHRLCGIGRSEGGRADLLTMIQGGQLGYARRQRVGRGLERLGDFYRTWLKDAHGPGCLSQDAGDESNPEIRGVMEAAAARRGNWNNPPCRERRGNATITGLPFSGGNGVAVTKRFAHTFIIPKLANVSLCRVQQAATPSRHTLETMPSYAPTRGAGNRSTSDR